MSEGREIRKRVVVGTTVEMAFEALTKASELREWFAEEAWTQVRTGGRYDLRWRQGYRSDGRFVKLDAPHGAMVSWHGTDEPGPTTVTYHLEAGADGVSVTVVHSGFGPDEAWDGTVAEAERGWTAGLENLQSTLETGVDLRTARRPFLGITLEPLTAERAAKEEIAADKGIYVLETVEGSAARAAGLMKGDVIVRLGGQETPSYQELGDALTARQAGDVVELLRVRGQQRETLSVTLGKRPQPEVPATAGELADRVAAKYFSAFEEIEAAVQGATEEEAGKRPAEGEWSAKEVLAHLSSNERVFQQYLATVAVNGWYDAGGIDTNEFPGQLAAILTVTPTLSGMLERYRADIDELAALVRYLPDASVTHKSRFRRINEALFYGPDHTRGHAEQIKNALAAARA